MAVAHGVQGWQRCQGIDRRAGWALQAGDKKTAAPSFPSRPSFASAHARSTKTRALQAEKPSSPARPSAPRRRRPPTSVRSLVLEQLLRVEEKGAFAALASGDPGAEGAAMPLSAQDRRDVTRLTSDILRWKRKLDHIVDTVNGDYHRGGGASKGARRRPKPFQPSVRQLLRMGTFELYFSRKPSYVVNEYVQLAKLTDARKAAGLINSVLRKVSTYEDEERSEEDLLSMDREDLVECLGKEHSHPDWLVSRWLQRFGLKECLELLEYNNSRPRYCLRTNPCNGLTTSEMKQRLDAAGVEYSDAQYLDDFVVIDRGLQNVFAAGLMRDQLCSVQDVSAGLVVDLMDPRPGDEVLDTCAAPGGKFYYAASRMGYEGKLVALDASENRLRALERGTRRFPDDTLQIETYPMAFEDWSRENEGVLFDKVLVDAPCSGTGVLAKRADLRWRRDENQLRELIGVQSRLLDCAKRHVKVGGVLCYSTCSIEEEENAQRVRTFLEKNAGFQLDVSKDVSKDVRKDGFLQTFPNRHGIDGAFAARLVRIS